MINICLTFKVIISTKYIYINQFEFQNINLGKYFKVKIENSV